MARTGVTYDDVANAAIELKDKGINPTIEQIRNLLGTGSSTTLARHLRAWKDKVQEAGEVARKSELPMELVGSIKSLWKDLQERTHTAITDHQAEHQDELSKLNQELSKYKQNNNKWQKLYQQLQLDKSEALSQVKKLEMLLRERDKEISVLTKVVDEKKNQIEKLHHIQQQAQVNFDVLQQSVREERLLAEERCDRIKEEAAAKIRDSHDELMATQANEKELLNQIRHQEDVLLKQESRLAHLEEAIPTYRKQVSDLQNKNEHLTEKLHSMPIVENENKRLEQQIKQFDKALSDYKRELNKKDEMIKLQIQEVSRLNDRYESYYKKKSETEVV